MEGPRSSLAAPFQSQLAADSHGQDAGSGRREGIGHGRKGRDEGRRHTARTGDIGQHGAAVVDFCRPLPVGNDIDGTGNGDGRPQMPCQRCCQVRVSRSDAAVDAEILTALMGGQTGDFRSIAADDGQGQFVQQALRSLGPETVSLFRRISMP